MLAALIFAATSAVASPPSACGAMTPSNVYMLHYGMDGKCSSLQPDQPCTAGVPVEFMAGAFQYSFACATHLFTWDFGDGANSNAITTFHTFAPGVYDVKLTIASPLQSVTLGERVVVLSDGGGTWPDFLDAVSANVVTFHIEPVKSGFTDWTFDFGDGTTTSLHGEIPPDVVHAYSKPGTYVVTLYTGSTYVTAKQIAITFPSRSRGARH